MTPNQRRGPQPARRGVCRYCNCTDTRPCVLGVVTEPPGNTCSWIDQEHTVCSNPECVKKWAQSQAKSYKRYSPRRAPGKGAKWRMKSAGARRNRAARTRWVRVVTAPMVARNQHLVRQAISHLERALANTETYASQVMNEDQHTAARALRKFVRRVITARIQLAECRF
ncbi:MAG: hypothetical protein LAP21_08335 [Acidobacteriia bacterium]|nr:hypothetical protein [Terriglobia bacterium]